MITIKYRKEDLSMTVTGHACTAPHGKDLVCCAVSTLVQCMIHDFQKREEAGDLKEFIGDIQEGDVNFRAIPKEWSRVQCLTMMRTYIEALRFTAESFPDAIRMEEM